jgi:hypothetical protein
MTAKIIDFEQEKLKREMLYMYREMNLWTKYKLPFKPLKNQKILPTYIKKRKSIFDDK